MDESGSACQSFLDAGQYTRDSILKYELVYGTNFVSPGARALRNPIDQKTRPYLPTREFSMWDAASAEARF